VTFKQSINKDQLQHINGVDQVKELGDNSWELLSSQGTDLSEVIYDFAVKNDLTLLEMTKRRA